MAKSKEKNRAIELRQKGESIKEIAKRLKIAKSTISLWCRDIELTPAQIQKLHEKMLEGSYRGRMKGARIQHERRIKITKELKKESVDLLGKISKRDLLVAGIALYWGKGSRKGNEVRISNSDPLMIVFAIEWLMEIWGVKKERITLRVGINRTHKDRIQEVEEYWSKITGVPRNQFTKTILIKAKNKKNYKNFPVHYGTLTIKVKKPTELHHRIIGLIKILGREALAMPGSRLVSKVVS